jgi:hypothetical protein
LCVFRVGVLSRDALHPDLIVLKMAVKSFRVSKTTRMCQNPKV